MTPLDARRAHDMGDACDRLFAGLASGIEAFGRDRETGLDAKHESPQAPNNSDLERIIERAAKQSQEAGAAQKAPRSDK